MSLRLSVKLLQKNGLKKLIDSNLTIYPIRMEDLHLQHKKVFKAVKGQYGRRKNTIRIARQAMEKAMQYAYRDRKAKKREFRSLWIQRINAGVRAEGLTYARFINGLSKTKIKLDRKVLAELAYNNPEVFKSIVKKVQSSLN